MIFLIFKRPIDLPLCLTHILTHNRKNGGGDNGHKSAIWNHNPSRKGREAPETPG